MSVNVAVITGKFGWEKVKTTGKKQKLGTVMVLPDGRSFRYARAGGTIGSGKLVMEPAVVASKAIDLAVAAAALAARTVTVTNATAAITVNKYQDGYIFVNDQGADTASGEGTMYVVKSHPAATTTEAFVVTLDEEAGIASEAWTTSTQVGLRANAYAAVVLWVSGTIVGMPLGVCPIEVVANDYFWLQTHGKCAALTDATTVVKGVAIGASVSVDGAIGLADNSDADDTKSRPIGVMDVVAASTEYSSVFLNIE